MIFKLKPVEDFVLERNEYWRNKSMEENGSELVSRTKHSRECEKYSEFIKRKITRSMFVYCDEADNPLPFVIGRKTGKLMYQVGSRHIDRASPKVLFEVERDGKDFFLDGHNLEAILDNCKTIKDLIHFEPVLTRNALREIGI